MKKSYRKQPHQETLIQETESSSPATGNRNHWENSGNYSNQFFNHRKSKSNRKRKLVETYFQARKITSRKSQKSETCPWKQETWQQQCGKTKEIFETSSIQVRDFTPSIQTPNYPGLCYCSSQNLHLMGYTIYNNVCAKQILLLYFNLK